MKMMHLLWVAALAVTSLALNLPCGIPFPMRNSTLEALQAIQDGTLDPGSLGAATLFGSNPGPKPWPRDNQKKVIIPYCYVDSASRKRLARQVDEAITIWMEALGGPASKQTGHAVEFKERRNDRNDPMFCYEAGSPAGGDWNDDIPFNTVPMEYKPSVDGGAATVGLIEDEEDPEPWMMAFFIGPNVPSIDIAHELGHLLGMAHEHQRNDRDNHVRFKCDKLEGYQQAYEKAKPEDKSKLCTDFYVAAKYGWVGGQYVAGQGGGGMNRAWPIYNTIREYDVDSIMHYYTSLHSQEDCSRRVLEQCAIVKYIDPKHHERGVAWLEKFKKPSKTDLSWVKLQYPWQNPSGSAGDDEEVGGGVNSTSESGKEAATTLATV